MNVSVSVPRILTFVLCFLSFPLHAATFLYLNSEAGDYIGQGLTKTITDSTEQPFVASKNFDNGVTITTSGTVFWGTGFAAAGDIELTPGYYENATRIPFQNITENAMGISGEGRGCNTLTGRFLVHEVVFNTTGGVDVFAADFEQFCDNSTSKLTGSIRFNSNVPIAALPVSVTISPSDYAYATDGGADFNWTMDGIFDVMTKGTDVLVTKYRSLDFTKWLERRGSYEFALPTVLSDPNIVIQSATVKLPTVTSGAGFGDFLIANGYSADGVINLDDFAKTDFALDTVPISTADHEFDVTTLIQTLAGSASHVGINIAVSWWDAYVNIAPNAELKLVYSVAEPVANTAPVITIDSPTNNGTYYASTPITVSATAFDQEDGDVTSSVFWTSAFFSLPPGPSFTTSIFYPGTHTLTAYAKDSAGLGVTKQVTFTVLDNTPPSLTFISPEPNSTFYEGELINLQAVANDIEDGDVSSSINWSSDLDGVLGIGGVVPISSLSLGTHTISAVAVDSANAAVTGNLVVNILPVTNSVPIINVTSPVNFSVIPSDQAAILQATASDLEDGDLTNSIEWSSSIDGFIGQGGIIGTFLTPGVHQIKAIVFDSLGQSASFISTITVTDATPAYCTAAGNVTTYEWAESVSIAGVNKITGANGGYVDLTSEPPIDVAPGANSIILTPGFSGGSYNEYWGIWIDLNEDFQFTPDEQFYSGNSNSTINASMVLPFGIVGNKRMRVVMAYGSPASPCGTFTYGEVEDYTVNILDAAPIPEPVPIPSGYCPTNGSSTNWEFIQSVSVAGYTFTSGNNGGYFDYTADTALNMTLGLNTVTLSPGFASGTYTENWQIWIDFNHDNTFSADEKVYGGSSNTTINAQVSVPALAVKGPTRMRVTMSYGSPANVCGNFSYGEAEDYTVIIN